MALTLPLALIGIGVFLWLLFAAAAQALPLFAGLWAGFAASHAGASGGTALLIGVAAFMAVIALGRALTALLPMRGARIGIILLFALPAAAATGSVVATLGQAAGIDHWLVALAVIAAAIIGGNSGRRSIDQPHS